MGGALFETARIGEVRGREGRPALQRNIARIATVGEKLRTCEYRHDKDQNTEPGKARNSGVAKGLVANSRPMRFL